VKPTSASWLGGGGGGSGDTIEIKGYAWSGQGNKITRVDLTANQGKTW
jgi:hypothetical protein